MPKFMSLKLISLFAVSAVALIAFAAACGGGDDPAADATTSPGDIAATPTTIPVIKATSAATVGAIKPVSINPETDPEGFLASLPEREVSCAENLVGGHVELVAILSGGDLAVGVSASAVAACFSAGTMASIVVGQIEADSGPLSDKTKSCISEKSAGIAFEALFSTVPQPDAVLGMFQAAFCLDADERLALQSAGDDSIFGGTESPSIDELECFVNDLGPDKIADAFGPFTGAGGALDPDFFSSSVKCGLVTDQDIADSGMTTEQMSCMFTQAGDLFQSFIAAGDTGTPPDLTQLAGLMGSFEMCGIDLDALGGGGDLGMIVPDGTVSPDDLAADPTSGDMTPAQGLCVATSVNMVALMEAMTPSATGDIDMVKLQPIIDSLAKCGVDPEVYLDMTLP